MAEILVTGAGGQLGSVLLQTLTRAGASVIGCVSPTGPHPFFGRVQRCELTDLRALEALLDREKPTRVIHTAALTSPAAAERSPRRATTLNREVTGALAMMAAERGAHLVHVSTDMVFDGERAPYSETDAARPQTVYGRSKLASEDPVKWGNGCVARVPLLYGVPAVARPTTFLSMIEALRRNRPVRLFEDEIRSPLSLQDAADALASLSGRACDGLFHLGGPERVSRAELGEAFAHALRIDAPSIVRCRRADYPGPDARPADLSLTSQRYQRTLGKPPGRPLAQALENLTTSLSVFRSRPHM